jgi:hypothetical protein
MKYAPDLPKGPKKSSSWAPGGTLAHPIQPMVLRNVEHPLELLTELFGHLPLS